MTNDELKSSVFIRPDNKMEGSYNIIAQRNNDLPSSIQARIVADMPSTISVRPHNKMEGLAEIKTPPMFTTIFSPIKDSFIRDGQNRMNYGSYEDMFIGTSDAGEIFRSLMQFDISSISNDKIIAKAELRLRGANTSGSTDIEIHELASSEWQEAGVTWRNTPALTNYISTFSSGSGFTNITVDVTGLVSDWHQGIKANNGFLLKQVDETVRILRSFFTRESATDPALVVTYYDPAVFSYGRSSMYGSLSVPHYSDLNGSIKVKPMWTDEDFPGSIEVNDPTDIEGSILVNKPIMPSEIVVKLVGHDDIPSTLTVRKINEPPDDMEGSIYVRALGDSTLGSSLKVARYADDDLSSSIVVHRVSDLNASIHARANGESGLESKLSVIHASKLPSSIEVTQYSDLAGKLQVRAEMVDDLTGQIVVHRTSDIPSAIMVTGHYLPSSVFVKMAGNKDLPSEVFITIPETDDLPSTIEVRGKSDLDGYIIARQSEVSIFPGSLTVHQTSDINSSIMVQGGQLESVINVRVEGENKLPSSIYVRANGADDLPSSIQPRVEVIEPLNSSIKVRRTARSSLLGTLLPRVEGADFLDSSVAIRPEGYDDLPSSVHVRANGENDLPAQINPRVTGQVELPGTLLPRVVGADLLNATIQVKRIAYPYAFIM